MYLKLAKITMKFYNNIGRRPPDLLSGSSLVDKSHPNSDSLSLIHFICFVPLMLMINHSLTWIDTKGNKKLNKD